MKMRRKRSNTSNMWLQNVSLKVNNGLEMECELDIPNGNYFYVIYIDSTPALFIQTVECVLLGDDEVDIVRLLYKGLTILQFRFASLDTKLQFLESAFHPREKDSANSSPASTPSLENI